jgi:hypothetical protein
LRKTSYDLTPRAGSYFSSVFFAILWTRSVPMMKLSQHTQTGIWWKEGFSSYLSLILSCAVNEPQQVTIQISIKNIKQSPGNCQLYLLPLSSQASDIPLINLRSIDCSTTGYNGITLFNQYSPFSSFAFVCLPDCRHAKAQVHLRGRPAPSNPVWYPAHHRPNLHL